MNARNKEYQEAVLSFESQLYCNTGASHFSGYGACQNEPGNQSREVVWLQAQTFQVVSVLGRLSWQETQVLQLKVGMWRALRPDLLISCVLMVILCMNGSASFCETTSFLSPPRAAPPHSLALLILLEINLAPSWPCPDSALMSLFMVLHYQQFSHFSYTLPPSLDTDWSILLMPGHRGLPASLRTGFTYIKFSFLGSKKVVDGSVVQQ